MKYFLDTNIIIYAIKNSYPSIINHFMNIPSYSIVIPSIVVSEIEYGARKSINYTKTINLYNSFISNFEIIDFDYNAAVQYGIIRSQLEKSGKLIGPNDMLISSIVLSEGGTLITHNTKEFSRIQNLKIEDWTL